MSIYKRGNSWYIDIWLGGARINRKAGDSKKSAIEAESELKTRWRLKQLHLEDIRDDCPPFYQIAADYLKHVQKTKSPRTFELEFTDYKKHLDPIFGQIPADQITEDLLQKFQQHQKSTTPPYGNRTINIHVGLVRKIINYGKGKKYLRDSFKLSYPMLSEPKKQHAYLDFDEWDALKNNITYDMGFKRVIVGRNTGLRPGELAHLSWNDVSFEMGTITVRSKRDVGWIIKTNEERVIKLGKDTIAILKELHKTRKSRWVFSEGDKPVKSIRRALSTAARNAGLSKRVTPNMLRHTFSTHMLASGASVSEVKELLGHVHLTTTEKYTHAIKGHLQASVERLDSPDGKQVLSMPKKKLKGKATKKKAKKK